MRPPAELPALIRLAVSDFKGLDRSLYRPWHSSYHSWHVGSDGNRWCHVCFAGAVMAGTLKRDCTLPATPVDCGAWRPALEALDDVRRGCWRALEHDGWLTRAEADDLMAEPSCLGPGGFKGWRDADLFMRWALKLAYWLEKRRAE